MNVKVGGGWYRRKGKRRCRLDNRCRRAGHRRHGRALRRLIPYAGHAQDVVDVDHAIAVEVHDRDSSPDPPEFAPND